MHNLYLIYAVLLFLLVKINWRIIGKLLRYINKIIKLGIGIIIASMLEFILNIILFKFPKLQLILINKLKKTGRCKIKEI